MIVLPLCSNPHTAKMVWRTSGNVLESTRFFRKTSAERVSSLESHHWEILILIYTG